mgnify:CR=1 FL=1
MKKKLNENLFVIKLNICVHVYLFKIENRSSIEMQVVVVTKFRGNAIFVTISRKPNKLIIEF